MTKLLFDNPRVDKIREKMEKSILNPFERKQIPIEVPREFKDSEPHVKQKPRSMNIRKIDSTANDLLKHTISRMCVSNVDVLRMVGECALKNHFHGFRTELSTPFIGGEDVRRRALFLSVFGGKFMFSFPASMFEKELSFKNISPRLKQIFKDNMCPLPSDETLYSISEAKLFSKEVFYKIIIQKLNKRYTLLRDRDVFKVYSSQNMLHKEYFIVFNRNPLNIVIRDWAGIPGEESDKVIHRLAHSKNFKHLNLGWVDGATVVKENNNKIIIRKGSNQIIFTVADDYRSVDMVISDGRTFKCTTDAASLRKHNILKVIFPHKLLVFPSETDYMQEPMYCFDDQELLKELDIPFINPPQKGVLVKPVDIDGKNIPNILNFNERGVRENYDNFKRMQRKVIEANITGQAWSHAEIRNDLKIFYNSIMFISKKICEYFKGIGYPVYLISFTGAGFRPWMRRDVEQVSEWVDGFMFYLPKNFKKYLVPGKINKEFYDEIIKKNMFIDEGAILRFEKDRWLVDGIYSTYNFKLINDSVGVYNNGLVDGINKTDDQAQRISGSNNKPHDQFELFLNLNWTEQEGMWYLRYSNRAFFVTNFNNLRNHFPDEINELNNLIKMSYNTTHISNIYKNIPNAHELVGMSKIEWNNLPDKTDKENKMMDKQTMFRGVSDTIRFRLQISERKRIQKRMREIIKKLNNNY